MQRCIGRQRCQQRGFTLIEVLIAISIFAMIGVASAQLLTRVVNVEQTMNARAERLFALQRAMAVLDRDLSQVVVRGVRNQFGDAEPALSGADGRLEFTRRGWSNPLGEARSSLQRVSYEFDGEQLERRYWSVLDRAQDSEPLVQVMLQDVAAFSVAFVDHEGNRTGNWPNERVPLSGELPPVGDANDANDASGDAAGQMPLAVEISLDVAPFGAVTRLWRVPQEYVPVAADNADDGDADDADNEGLRGAGDDDGDNDVRSLEGSADGDDAS